MEKGLRRGEIREKWIEKIYINLKKQSQSPAFGWKSEALNEKSEGDEWMTNFRAQFEKTKPIYRRAIWRNISINNALWRFWQMKAAKKQSQFSSRKGVV